MKKKLLIYIAVFCGTVLAAQTGAYHEAFAGIDRQILSFMKSWNIQGGAVAITKDGKMIYNRGFGYADAAGTRPTQPDAQFRIASVSKPITAMAIMKLVEQGKLSLNDTVFGKNKILEKPYYLEAIRDKRIYAITVRHLLEHTAGWDRNLGVDGFDHNDPAFFPLHVTRVEKEGDPVGDSTLVKFSLRKGLTYHPGIYFSYSNVGYLVLGKIIERISGMSYESYVSRYILEPAEAAQTRLGKNLKAQRFAGEVEYMSNDMTESCYGDGKLVPAQYGGFNLEAMNAHGGWVSSAPDLCRILLAADANSSRQDLLNSKSLQLMVTPSASNPGYAKGWSVNARGNRWHTGSIDGAASFVCITADGYTWAFLFNSRANNSASFWRDFDRLPWNCIKSVKEFPDVNYLQ